jgi:hypothetical protein
MTIQKTAKRGEFNPDWPVPDDYLLELCHTNMSRLRERSRNTRSAGG